MLDAVLLAVPPRLQLDGMNLVGVEGAVGLPVGYDVAGVEEGMREDRLWTCRLQDTHPTWPI